MRTANRNAPRIGVGHVCRPHSLGSWCAVSVRGRRFVDGDSAESVPAQRVARFSENSVDFQRAVTKKKYTARNMVESVADSPSLFSTVANLLGWTSVEVDDEDR